MRYNQQHIQEIDGLKIFLPTDELHSNDEFKNSPVEKFQNWNQSDFFKIRYQTVVNILKSQERTYKSVLDIGSEFGHVINEISLDYSEAEYYGIEISLTASLYAHKNFKNVEISVADAYNLPFKNESFDCIIVNNLWEHLEHPLLLLSEIRRVLNIDGLVIISTPNRYRLNNLIRVALGWNVTFRSQHHITEYSLGQIREVIDYHHGLELIDIIAPKLPYNSIILSITMIILKPILNILKSRHILEQIVFYMVKKVNHDD